MQRYKLFVIAALFSFLLAACSASVEDSDTATLEIEAESPASSEDTAAATAAPPTEDSSENAPADDEGPPADETASGESDQVTDEAGAEGPVDDTEEAAGPDENQAGSGSEQADDGADSESDAPSETGEETQDNSADTSEDGILTVDDRTDLLLQITSDWETDFNRHTVPYNEIVPVLFRDAIRSLDQPTFAEFEEAAEWLPDEDPVIAFELDGDARAYPLRILTAHEIVNDQFGDVPVVITYCPLCNSALVFNSLFDGRALEFGTTGLLRNSDLIMYDRSSETLWQQFTGEAIVGEYAGERLEFLPSSIVSFADFRSAFPDGKVLSRDTGFNFTYDLSSYQAYDQIGQEPYLFLDYDGAAQVKEIDQRLPAMERVVSLLLDGSSVAYPLSTLSEVGVINDSQAGVDLVVFHSFGTASAFYNPAAQQFDDVGATGVFSPIVDGQQLTFSKVGDDIIDEQTGSTWNILGQAVDGPLAGSSLDPILHGDHFWFSWAAFNPDTIIYEG